MFAFVFYTIIQVTNGTVSYINCPLMGLYCGYNFNQNNHYQFSGRYLRLGDYLVSYY